MEHRSHPVLVGSSLEDPAPEEAAHCEHDAEDRPDHEGGKVDALGVLSFLDSEQPDHTQDSRQARQGDREPVHPASAGEEPHEAGDDRER